MNDVVINIGNPNDKLQSQAVKHIEDRDDLPEKRSGSDGAIYYKINKLKYLNEHHRPFTKPVPGYPPYVIQNAFSCC